MPASLSPILLDPREAGPKPPYQEQTAQPMPGSFPDGHIVPDNMVSLAMDWFLNSPKAKT